MRITKNPEERRNEILDVAAQLFTTYGYDKTSTQDIINQVGIAKGTLYYHFKSKEEIMDALIERIGEALVAAGEKIAKDKTIPIYERIVKMMIAMELSDQGMLEHIHKPQNALLNQKMEKLTHEKVLPIFSAVINEGVEQGLFTTPYPNESAEMIFGYVSSAFDYEVIQKEGVDMEHKIKALSYIVDRILGIQDGSILDSMKEIFKGIEM